MRKMTYEKMRASGLCTSCGKLNPTPERCLCPECRNRKNENRRSNNDYRKKIGICVRCGKNRAEPNRVLCYECAGKEADDYIEKGRTDDERERDRNRKRDLAEHRLQNGICPRCGKYPSMYGGECKKCRAYARRYRESHRDGISRSERRSYGICYICGKEMTIPGKGVCKKCYEVRCGTIPAMLANQNAEYFRQLNNSVFAGRNGG